jgi:Na+/melibiose symporter-like transporter
MGKEKKRGKLRKFFLFAMIAGAVAAVLKFVKKRRGAGMEESEWQELPPPER